KVQEVEQNILTETESPKEKRPSTAIDKPKVDASIAATTTNTEDKNRNNNSVKQPEIERKSAKSKQSGSTSAKGDDYTAKEKFRLTKLAKSLKRDLDKETILDAKDIEQISKHIDQIMNVYKETQFQSPKREGFYMAIEFIDDKVPPPFHNRYPNKNKEDTMKNQTCTRGRCNYRSYFNHWVQELLRQFQEFVVAYVDDIVIFSNTLEEDYKHVKKVLDLFQKNRQKIQLFKTEVKYVGHMVSRNGIKPIYDKTKAIEEIPMPSTVSSPTSSKKIELPEKQQSDVNAIKAALTSPDTLIAIDFSKRFYLYTDVSDVGTGLMITQRDKVIYDSKKLDKHRKRYDTRDRELLAIERWSELETGREWDQDFVTQVVESYEHHKKKEWLQALIRRDDVVKDNDGLLYLVDKGKILVDNKQIETILQEAHATTFGGHVGKNRLAARLKDLYFFKWFWTVIEKFIKACPECQKCRIETVKQGFLNPLPIPDRPWKDISMDYIKLAFLKDGAPQTIVSDQDSIFPSSLWKKMMFQNVNDSTRPCSSRWSNGKNRKKWCSKIHIIEASINGFSNVNSSTGRPYPNTAKFSIDTDLAKEKKLLPLYCGPFKVIQKSTKNNVNYKIQIANSRKQSRTVHIVDTKLYIQDDKYFRPANKKVHPILSQEIEKIVSHREVSNSSQR
ncbi:hypothetical protein CYY_010259, partial [Polysphondylium violaceum]